MTRTTSDPQIHMAIGSPWKQAIIDYVEPDSVYEPWGMPPDIRTGDHLVTVLDTAPRTIMCLEEVRLDRAGRVLVVESEDFHTLPTVRGVEVLAGVRFPTAAGRIDITDADRLLATIRHADRFPQIPDEETDGDTAEHARTLFYALGCCIGCGDRLPLTAETAEDQLYIHLPVDRAGRANDCPGVLCPECSSGFRRSGLVNLVDYQFSLRPTCICCGARRTAGVSWGMPAFPGPYPPWLMMHGCVIDADTPDYECTVCGHRWRSARAQGPRRRVRPSYARSRPRDTE